MRSEFLASVADSAELKQHQFFHQPLVHIAPLPECEVCVIVPVRNEAEILWNTLLALANQVDEQGDRLDAARYEVILLANNCTDRSAAIAHQFAQQHPHFMLHIVERTLPPEEAYIGRVRQLLMDEACDRLLSINRTRGVIASTDGDTCVAPNWLAATLQEIAIGADAVGGRIVTNRAERAALDPYARACHLREVGYRFLVTELEAHLDPDPADPLPRHFQHYGASLALTAESYRRVGGLPPVRSPEDVALYRSLVRANARIRHSLRVRVSTSARQTGRTHNGLANQLNQWTAMGQQHQLFLVESAAAVETRFLARRELRSLWQHIRNGDRVTIAAVSLPANRLGVSPAWLNEALQQSQSFGALFEQVEQQQFDWGQWQQRWQPVRIEEAIADLRLRLEPLRRRARVTPPL